MFAANVLVTSEIERICQAVYKLGRNAGLDEAKQVFSQPYQEYFGRESQDAIESLKDNTMTLFQKQPLAVFVQRLPDQRLGAKITSDNKENGRALFEGSGYLDEAQIEQAIRLSNFIDPNSFSEGFRFVYVQTKEQP